MATNHPSGGGAATEKRKPTFVKVEELKPSTNGHNLIVKIVNSNPVPVPKPRRSPMSLSQRPHPQRPSRINECLVGDETGSIVFTARNEQGNGKSRGFCLLSFGF